MSFTFGGVPSSSGAAPNSTTTSAPAQGGLFGAAASGNTGFSFKPLDGASGANSTTPATTGGLFGKASSTAQMPAGNIFGAASSTAPSTSSTPAASAPAKGVVFGGTAPASGLFGSAGASSAPAGGLFAAQNKTLGTITTPSASASGGFLSNPGNTVFGNKTSTTPSTQGAASAATPAKPTFSLASTTPAGAPPTGASKPAGLFGITSSQQTGGFMGGAAAKPSTSTTSASQPSTTAPSGSGLFGNVGGGQTAGSSGGLFGAKSATSAASAPGGLFGTTATSTTQPTPSAPAAAPASSGTTSALFGLKPAAPATGLAPAAASTGGLFSSAAATTSTPASSGSTPAPAAVGGLFGSKSAATITTSQPATSSAATATTSTPTPTTTTTPSIGSGGMFGTKTASDSKEKPNDAAKLATQNGTASMLGASTTGPPSQMARLKNKTMEDIVTRWASDLSKYQKEFKEQATVVSNWDRNLVDNGEKIQKLYLDTFEAERASHEIERQLATVESQQEELEAWLNRYESEVQDMFAKQMGPGEQLGGPDQERERTYKLAEKLTQQLDEKSRDLSKMVKEINDISGTLNRGAKAEDPLSQIVRVLNGHLTQLQWIDVNASAVQAKVTAAQKLSSNLGGHYAGGESEAVDGFYRSYMGRR